MALHTNYITELLKERDSFQEFNRNLEIHAQNALLKANRLHNHWPGDIRVLQEILWWNQELWKVNHPPDPIRNPQTLCLDRQRFFLSHWATPLSKPIFCPMRRKSFADYCKVQRSAKQSATANPHQQRNCARSAKNSGRMKVQKCFALR